MKEKFGMTSEELRSFWSWAPGADYLNNSEFSLAWRVARGVVPVNMVLRQMKKSVPFDCIRCGSEEDGFDETVEHAFFHCEKVWPLWSYVREVVCRMEPLREKIEIDLGHICGNAVPEWSPEKRWMFRSILAVARNVVWQTRLKEVYEEESFTSDQLIICFKHQLKVKIRCDRRRLAPAEFSRRWVVAISLVHVRGNSFDLLI